MMRREHPGRPIVWLDADARVRRPPSLFDSLDCDVAAHWKDGEELLSGTLYIGANDTATELLQEWLTDCQSNPGEWDQRCLQAVLNSSRRFRIQTLPADYTAIFDAGMSDHPVIEHLQASRRLKR